MSSSFFTMQEFALKMLLSALGMQELPPIAIMQYTVKREKEWLKSFSMKILFLSEEKKE